MDTIQVFKDADTIATAARDYVLKAAQQSIAGHGAFNIALSGGSTPKKLFELLARQTEADWSKWHFFMGDERFVPLDDDRSNQKLANDTLLNKLDLKPDQIHAVPVNEATATQAAELYEKQIKDYFGQTSETPAFDLILLGMGSDGHTASLFPGKPSLNETERLVVASEPGVLPPPVDRVTFTLPLINAAKRVLFMAAGADKAEAFAKVKKDLTKSPEEATTPAGKVRPANGELQWFVDKVVAGSEGMGQTPPA